MKSNGGLFCFLSKREIKREVKKEREKEREENKGREEGGKREAVHLTF